MNKIISFVKEARAELQKVSWPSKDQTIKYTGIVIGVSLATALFLGVLDLLFSVGVGELIV